MAFNNESKPYKIPRKLSDWRIFIKIHNLIITTFSIHSNGRKLRFPHMKLKYLKCSQTRMPTKSCLSLSLLLSNSLSLYLVEDPPVIYMSVAVILL